MTIFDAQQMLASADFNFHPQLWLDLGCGSGTFTLALAELLPPGSQVIGMDKSRQVLPNHSPNGNKIKFDLKDFTQPSVLDQKIHGILMANALHYIRDQARLIDNFRSSWGCEIQFIIVEYDTYEGNPWVPYPIPYNRLSNIFGEYSRIGKLSERKSIYNNSNMYAAQIISDYKRKKL